MITYKIHEQERWILTEEGKDIAAQGSHEAKVFSAIPPGTEGLSMEDLIVRYYLKFLIVSLYCIISKMISRYISSMFWVDIYL